MKRTPMLTAVGLLLLVVFSAAPVLAAPTKAQVVGSSIVVSSTPGGALVLAPRSDLKDKTDWNPTADAALIQGPVVAPMSCELGCTAPLSGYGSRYITPPGGTGNYINEQYSASVYHLSRWRATNTGTSSATWMGTNPYYAAQVGNIDTFTVSVVGISSVSLPAGLGWSAGTNTATYNPGNVYNNWGNSHDWRGAGVTFTAGIGSSLLNMSETGQGNFLFGMYWFNVNASQNSVSF